MRRLHADDEYAARAKQAAYRAGHARLRRLEQGFDIPRRGIELLAFVDEIAVGLRERLLDTHLQARQRQLLELAVRGQQDLRGRRLERDAALRAEDRVAQMDAAADRVRRSDRLELLDQRDRREPLAVDRYRHAALEADLDLDRLLGLVERAGREHPRGLGDGVLRVERLGAADRHAPEPAIDRIRRSFRRHRQTALLEIPDLVGALPRVVAHGLEHLELRRKRLQDDLEANLVVARGRAAVRNRRRAERF